MFHVVQDAGDFFGYSIIDKETFDNHFLPSDSFYSSESYTECDIWIANKLAAERITQWKQDKLEAELNALENQSVEC